MILITGASGKTGRELIRALQGDGVKVRAFVRASHVEHFSGLPNVETFVGDLMSAKDIRLAVQGVRTIYHIPPNMHPAEIIIAAQLFDAARSAGAAKVVYHSVLHPQTRKMPHHWNKMRVEERLFETRLVYTILQPTAYMQNLLAGWRTIVNEGVYSVPYPPASRISLVDLRDIVSVARKALMTDELDYGTFELAGTRPLSQTEVAEKATAVIGRKVKAVEIPLSEWQQAARSAGALSPYAIETLSAMFSYYAEIGLEGNPFILESILGRPPTGLADFFRRQIQAPAQE